MEKIEDTINESKIAQKTPVIFFMNKKFFSEFSNGIKKYLLL